MSYDNASFLDRGLIQLEQIHHKLSHWSMYPVVGTFPAIVKVLLGAIETVVSAIFLILSLIPSICSQTARGLLAFSALHIGRGLLRTFIGTFLAVPILGSVFICGLDRIAGDCCGIFSLAGGNGPEAGEDLGHSIIFA